MKAAKQAKLCYGKKYGKVEGACCKKQFWLEKGLRTDPCQLDDIVVTGRPFRRWDRSRGSGTAAVGGQFQSRLCGPLCLRILSLLVLHARLFGENCLYQQFCAINLCICLHCRFTSFQTLSFLVMDLGLLDEDGLCACGVFSKEVVA